MAAEIGILAYDDRIKAGNWQRKAATHCLHNALLQLLVCDSFAGRPDEPWIDRIVIHLKERTVTREHQVSTCISLITNSVFKRTKKRFT